MEIIDIIESFVELDIRDAKLKDSIEKYERYYDYSMETGKNAYSDGNFEREQRAFTSAKQSLESKTNAQNARKSLQPLLKEIQDLYLSAVSRLGIDDLKDVLAKVMAKRESKKDELHAVRNRSEWALEKSNGARDAKKIDDEIYFGRIFSECTMYANDLERYDIPVYLGFISDLTNRINHLKEIQNDDRTVYDPVTETTVVHKPSYDTDEFGVVHKPVYSSSESENVYKENGELNAMFENPEVSSVFESSVVLK